MTRRAVIVIGGLPGSGKSVLLEDLFRLLEDHGYRVLAVNWTNLGFLKEALKSGVLPPGDRFRLFTSLWIAVKTLVENAWKAYDLVLVEKWGWDIVFYHGREYLPLLAPLDSGVVDFAYIVEGGSAVSHEGIEPASCIGVSDCHEEYRRIVHGWRELSPDPFYIATGPPDAGYVLELAKEVLYY